MSAPKKAPAAAADAAEAAPKKKGLSKAVIIGIILGVVAIEWAVAFLFLPSATAPAAAEENAERAAKKHAAKGETEADHPDEAAEDEELFSDEQGKSEEPAEGDHKKEGESKKEEGHGKKEEGHGKKEEGHGKKEEKGGEEPKKRSIELRPTDIEEFEMGEFTVTISHAAASTTSIVTFKLYGTIQHKHSEYVAEHYELVRAQLKDSIETIIRSSEAEDLAHPGLDLIKRKIFETTNKMLGKKPVLKGIVFNNYMYYDQ